MLLQLTEIRKYYKSKRGTVKALDNIDLTVEEGEMLAVIGQSGSGKSTLLSVIGGIDIPDNGAYIYKGNSLNYKNSSIMNKFRKQQIGFILQNLSLINEKTVFENVSLPLEYRNISLKERKLKVYELLEKTGLNDKALEYPRSLSGGECQRVAIARALVSEPQLLLADEPTGSLDPETQNVILEIFKNLNKQGYTIVIVTHSQQVSCICDRIVKMDKGCIQETTF